MSSRKNDKDKSEFIPIAGAGELIPEGEYAVVCKNACIRTIYQGPRLDAEFEIFEGSAHAGVRLSFFASLGKDGKRLSPNSKYFRAWTIANGGKRPKRSDRLLPQIFKGKLFRAKVETANKGDPLKEYSVVRELIGLEAGGPDNA